MLAFVGLGLEQSPTLQEVAFLKNCEEVYFESYTSPATIDNDLLGSLSKAVEGKKRIEIVTREFVEDGRKILEAAKGKVLALVCSGDPMVATTHQELRVRAIRAQIKTKIFHGSSILCALSGELGLSSYSFGKTVTVTRNPLQYTAYNTIYQNLLRGLHSTLLLEWDEKSRFFLSTKEAVLGLLEAEKDLKYGILTSETLLLGASQIGSEAGARINACTFSEARDVDFGTPPITLVIPGKLHFTEVEALSAITGRTETFFVQDNAKNIQKLAPRMVEKYAQRTLDALARARVATQSQKDQQFSELFENVELYTQDAQRFLNEGREELAILSIGYAEGLLDSLRFTGALAFEW